MCDNLWLVPLAPRYTERRKSGSHISVKLTAKTVIATEFCCGHLVFARIACEAANNRYADADTSCNTQKHFLSHVRGPPLYKETAVGETVPKRKKCCEKRTKHLLTFLPRTERDESMVCWVHSISSGSPGSTATALSATSSLGFFTGSRKNLTYA